MQCIKSLVMDISSWLTELFINHFTEHFVYIFYSISAHYSFIAIEFKLEMNFFYNVFGNVSTSDPIISLIFIFSCFSFIHANEFLNFKFNFNSGERQTEKERERTWETKTERIKICTQNWLDGRQNYLISINNFFFIRLLYHH
jgi:hypothetical protein